MLRTHQDVGYHDTRRERDLALVGQIEMVGRHALLNSMYLCGFAQVQRLSTVMLSFIRVPRYADTHTYACMRPYIGTGIGTCIHS
jgi:hypothetical protein